MQRCVKEIIHEGLKKNCMNDRYPCVITLSVVTRSRCQVCCCSRLQGSHAGSNGIFLGKKSPVASATAESAAQSIASAAGAGLSSSSMAGSMMAGMSLGSPAATATVTSPPMFSFPTYPAVNDYSSGQCAGKQRLLSGAAAGFPVQTWAAAGSAARAAAGTAAASSSSWHRSATSSWLDSLCSSRPPSVTSSCPGSLGLCSSSWLGSYCSSYPGRAAQQGNTAAV